MDDNIINLLKLKIEILESLVELRDIQIHKLNSFIKENNVIEVVIKDDSSFADKLFRRR